MVGIASDKLDNILSYQRYSGTISSIRMYNVNKDSVMKTIEVDGKKIELYDSIEDLPILRFHKFNKMLLVDAGVGSDLADFDRHIERAIIYASGDTPKMAVKELQNLRQNVYLIQSEVSPRCMAFAALVKSIDGVEYNDMSDDGLQKVMNIRETLILVVIILKTIYLCIVITKRLKAKLVSLQTKV